MDKQQIADTGITCNQPVKAKADRVAGLDTIRFICALWVVFSHLGFVPLPVSMSGNLETLPEPLLLLRGFHNNLFCGVAAVIVFFIISGFCIHFPFRNAPRIPVAAFLARRYLRIGLPFVVAFASVLLWKSSGVVEFYNAILWSLVAELVYYTLYPVLFPFIRNFGWRLVIGAYTISFLIISLHPKATEYHDFGLLLTWMVGLPCWLLGCMLAKSFSATDQPPSLGFLWGGRCIIWSMASFCSLLRFHSSIGYPWTLNLFAIACFFWLRAELRWFQTNPPYRSLERAGAWSYSLYLCHIPIFIFLAKLSTMAGLNLMIVWLLKITACLVISYLFFRVVESPAHRLAGWVGRALRRG